MSNNSDFRSKLKLLDNRSDLDVEKYINEITSKQSILIWGCIDTYTYGFLKKFTDINKVRYYGDNDQAKWGTKMNGLLVLSPEEVVEKVKENSIDHIIITSMQHLKDIENQLLSLRIEQDMIDSKGHSIARSYMINHFFNSHMDDFEKVYSYLSDERSKAVYLAKLNYKISLDNQYLADIASPNEDKYFDKELLHANENEIFCDCGSHDGFTLKNFISWTGGKYKKCIAIEADKDLYSVLNNNVKENGYKNVQTYNLACWNEKAILKFQSSQTLINKAAAHITEDGDVYVQADDLDNILKDEKVTFLKMDIEGAEEMALKGARRVIQENNPILAICIYHKLEDYYTIPLIIKEINPEYELFIRHYTDMDWETVCYAIPKKHVH